MIKQLAIFFLVTFALQAVGQKINKTILDSDLNKEILIGYCNLTGLEKGEFGEVFKTGYEQYKPQNKYIKKLIPVVDEVEFTVVLGTWCSDSEEQVPRFFKILNELSYNPKRVKIIAVNQSLSAILVSLKDFDIQKVPTFIVYKNGLELGRIIETPEKKIERDLWNIISGSSK